MTYRICISRFSNPKPLVHPSLRTFSPLAAEIIMDESMTEDVPRALEDVSLNDTEVIPVPPSNVEDAYLDKAEVSNLYF